MDTRARLKNSFKENKFVLIAFWNDDTSQNKSLLVSRSVHARLCLQQ